VSRCRSGKRNRNGSGRPTYYRTLGAESQKKFWNPPIPAPTAGILRDRRQTPGRFLGLSLIGR
jgi:hypothetical protein